MTHQLEPAQMAHRMIRATEAANLDLLASELNQAEQLMSQDEERLELLGAIAHEMRVGLEGGGLETNAFQRNFKPHLDLLRHLSAGGSSRAAAGKRWAAKACA